MQTNQDAPVDLHTLLETCHELHLNNRAGGKRKPREWPRCLLVVKSGSVS